MNKTDGEKIIFWTLPVLGIIWFSAFLLFPGFVHPMSPTMSAEQVAAFYRDPHHLARIRYSMIVFNWFGIGIVPFLALIVTQIRRMGHHTPILAYCYLGCLTGGPTLFFLADLFWLLAAFRPERDAEADSALQRHSLGDLHRAGGLSCGADACFSPWQYTLTASRAQYSSRGWHTLIF